MNIINFKAYLELFQTELYNHLKPKEMELYFILRSSDFYFFTVKNDVILAMTGYF